MSKVELESKPEAKNQSQLTVAARTEQWWTVTARNHVVYGEVNGEMVKVQFEGYRVDLDLADEDDAKRAKALRNSGLDGKQIFRIGGSYPDHEFGSDVEALRSLRAMVDGDPRDEVSRKAGIDKIRALFTRRELAEAGISPLTEDPDELIALALRLKKFSNKKET